jgi:cob(I)alamin adenosyltransferase
MGSISTTKGDNGQTGLAGGIRVSKGSPRVEAYGTVDELISTLGSARSLCHDRDLDKLVHTIQLDLFKVGSALATAPNSPKPPVPITGQMVDGLTFEVHRLEAVEGVLSDWSLPGALSVSAAFDVARTVCRRAERCVVRLTEAGEAVEPAILAYLNRLSDLLWLCGRTLEREAGVSGSLRAETGQSGNRWSRAW